MTKQVYTAKDLQELLGVSESKAYQYIKIMNQELSEKGFLTVRGRFPVHMFRNVSSALRQRVIK